MLNVECSLAGVEIFLPFLLSLYEATSDNASSSQQSSTAVSKTARSSAMRYALLVGVFTVSAFASVSTSTQRSTYICPVTSYGSKFVPVSQFLGLFLDTSIIIGLSTVAQDGFESSRPKLLLGRLAFISAGALSIQAGLFILRNPEHMIWSFHLDSRIISDLLFATVFGSSFLASVVYLMSELRPSIPITVATCVSIYTYHFSTHTTEFWPSPSRSTVVLSSIAFLSMAGIVRLWREASRSQRSLSLNGTCSRFLMVLFVFMSVLFLAKKTPLILHPSKSSRHPIDYLMSNAQHTSDQWRKQAATSQSLEEAVYEYQSRYGVPPPPNFDKWYEYATARGSLIIDDFEQINNDLLPFWAIEPAKIREMTAHMLERTWTDAGGLRIANGSSQLTPHVVPTHRWSLEGTSSIIKKFAQWLPDMDIAMNINDECRVAVPWRAMEDLKNRGTVARRQLNESKNFQPFSTNAHQLWPDTYMQAEPPYSPQTVSEYFAEASIASSFTKYGVIGCPPNSPSIRTSWWNKGLFCADCTSPHALGPFLSNWTLSGSLCHQPDLENLHGFHLSPSSFKPTTSLFPIFSQSKIPGFSDIVFPSPWNYVDKVTFDSSKNMAFSEKEKSVFWRGGTSEGYAAADNWEGMQRQRFVHLANYAQGSTKLNLILPNNAQGTDYSYRSIPLSSVLSATNIDVSFVGVPVRCYDKYCAAQAREFYFNTSTVDFQEHWKYKYLFDFDGAGFSGRFLPFLESSSLVFRAASFRQWFEERLTAWKDYVPVDTRLHDVWSLLAYFGGLGKNGEYAHEKEAGRIADEGRDWAAKVLRKEDMEIYMFRLLLEWGRIVDDRRNELGFVLPPK
ncbi:Beta-1,2-xylosyltransferase 1 [Lachnellula arida]|uniref:Beta-1,2-xylosyltransferase 1 n=1 Tax=Lachnellula arida TaxID=1316785 RepID=A0A8T9BDX6_9HELO|nr:Beta-1,2-xylosyltransferase 1 [Lachnellula arida]